MGKMYKMLMRQHIGAPGIPEVAAGDRVKRGQKIARFEGLGANIHASVQGKVAEVTEEYVLVEADDAQPDTFEPIAKNENIAEMIKDSGLVGLGGAGFPTYVKLATKLEGGYVICNAAECEPLLKHNITRMEKYPEQVYRGMELAMQATGATKGIFAIKGKNAGAIASMRGVIKNPAITIHELPDLYPMGEERAVIRESLGILLQVDQLPSVSNCVILNAETMYRIAEAVDTGKPLISKDVTIVGKMQRGHDSQVFLDVSLGTSVADLVAMAGGIDGEVGEIIMGGPFTGRATTLDAPMVKTTGGIIPTMEFMKVSRPLGLLVCACGANLDRMNELAQKMGANVVGVQSCKQAKAVKNALKCENPGNCPGQAEKIMELRKAGAEVLLVGNCSDCTNTVMCVAPKLKMPVYHITDHVMRTVNHSLVRRLPIEQ